MRRSSFLLLASTVVLAASACSQADVAPSAERTAARRSPIYGGTYDPSMQHLAIVEIDSKLDAQGSLSSCSGTIFHVAGGYGYVLTAAHCVNDPAYPPDVVNLGPDSFSPQQHYKVVAYVAHPNYDGNVYDFGLVKFQGADCAKVPTIPLMTKANDNLAVGQTVQFVGYGVTDTDPNNTKRFEVDGTINQLTSLYLKYPQGTGIGGPCEGDSGGPALSTLGGVQIVSGVTSYGDPNCTEYGVSSRVSSAIDWIDSWAGTVGAGGACDGAAGAAGSSGTAGSAGNGEGGGAAAGASGGTGVGPGGTTSSGGSGGSAGDGPLQGGGGTGGGSIFTGGSTAGAPATPRGDGPTATPSQSGGCSFGGSSGAGSTALGLFGVLVLASRRRRARA